MLVVSFKPNLKTHFLLVYLNFEKPWQKTRYIGWLIENKYWGLHNCKSDKKLQKMELSLTFSGDLKFSFLDAIFQYGTQLNILNQNP